MKTNYLLPHKYKTIGWALFILGFISGLLIYINSYQPDLFKISVLSIFDYKFDLNEPSTVVFRIIKNNVIDEIALIAFIVGALLIGFSKEKVEDEFIYKLRTDSLVWAMLLNSAILILTIIFVYGASFIHILVFNMFTPLLFFVVRFNFLKFKSDRDEE